MVASRVRFMAHGSFSHLTVKPVFFQTADMRRDHRSRSVFSKRLSARGRGKFIALRLQCFQMDLQKGQEMQLYALRRHSNVH